MSKTKDHSGYIIDIKKPTRKGKNNVACLVVTPKHKNRDADVGAKVKRDLGRRKAIQIAYELLERCKASSDLLAMIVAMNDGEKPRKA